MVIYIHVRTKGRLSIDSLNARLEELGGKASFTYEGKSKRRTAIKHIWHHTRYPGGVEIGELPDEKLIYASAKSVDAEERLASSWIEWLIRHFHRRISEIVLLLEWTKVGRE